MLSAKPLAKSGSQGYSHWVSSMCALSFFAQVLLFPFAFSLLLTTADCLALCYCLSLSLTVSHCLSLPLIVSHCLSLSLTASHCLSQAASHYLSLPLTTSHYRLLPHTSTTSHCLSYHVVLVPLTDWLTD